MKTGARVYFGDGGSPFSVGQSRRETVRRPMLKERQIGIARQGGGVSARVVLASGGIARGGVVSVRSAEKPRTAMPIAKPKVVAVIPPKVEDDCVPPMDERGNGCNMQETEKRLADFLGAAQEARAKCEDIGKPDLPSEIEESIAGGEAESSAVLPELPFGDIPQTGKRRKRRGGKKDCSTEVSETERAEVQSAVEAGSDAAERAE